MPGRVSFYTLGCRLNQSETASLQNSFAAEGYQLVDINEPADITVVNTCTVTGRGDANTCRLVKKINRINPNTKIALVGCQAQIQKEELTGLENVKLIVGNAEKMNLVDILHEIDLCEETQVIAPSIPRKSFTMPTAGMDRKHTRANLKIQDGCDFFCSFCEIPYARGRARSRIFDDIIKEAKSLAGLKHKEIVITGINVGMYKYKNKTIIDVIDELNKIPKLERIRISSIEPTTIPFKLLEKMNTTKLCRHLHIPMQSASNKILKKMNRKYAIKDYEGFIIKARREAKDLCIGADIMVGFPGETEKDFKQTRDFLKNIPVDYFHVFSYSDRRLNKSRNFKGKIDCTVAQKRSEILRKIGAEKRKKFMKRFIGTKQPVLFEQKKNGRWSGLTDNYIRVKCLSDKKLDNKIIDVKLTGVKDQYMIGSIS